MVLFTPEQNIICSQTQLKAVVCRSCGELSTNEKGEQFASSSNITCIILFTVNKLLVCSLFFLSFCISFILSLFFLISGLQDY